MKLSIIVPVYNMEADDKLKYCLDSLVNQTIDDYEIIAVDDCSTDNSFFIMQEYEKKYPDKVVALHSFTNGKQGSAKNYGLTEAQGEWIGFMDADDWAAPDMFEKLLKRAEETGADMVGCDYHLTDEHTMKIGKVVANNKPDQVGVLDHDKYKSLILDSGSLVVKIYKRSIIIDHPSRFPEGIFYEDNAICNSWMLRAKHFEYVQEPLYYYYQHAESTVHVITERRCLDRMDAGRMMIDEAKKYGYLEEYKPEIMFKYTILFYVNTLFSYMPGVKHVKYSFVKKLGKEMKETFPDFMENPYYIERVHPEEKKLIKMQMKSTLFFICYYKLLWFYRGLRK